MAGRVDRIGPGYFEGEVASIREALYQGGGDWARDYEVGGHSIVLGGKFIEPAWESFEPAVDVVLDGEILYGRGSTNVASYHNEGYHYGSCESLGDALALLEERFAGHEAKVTGRSCWLNLDVGREDRRWDDPEAVQALRSREDTYRLVESARRIADDLYVGYVADESRSPRGEGNDFVRARRPFASELEATFGHGVAHEGVPLSDAQSDWLHDIVNAQGTIADDTASMGYVPATVPPDIYDMSMAGVLTTDEAYQVIATAISTIPTEAGDGHGHARWPGELVDVDVAREIAQHYQSTSIEVRERLVRDDMRHIGRKNVCLFLDDGSGIRKRYANLSGERVTSGATDGRLRVSLPVRTHLFGYDDGELVREVLPAGEIKAQMGAARVSYARQRAAQAAGPIAEATMTDEAKGAPELA